MFRRQVQSLFQNPCNSLSTMYSVFRVIGQFLRIHRVAMTASNVNERCASWSDSWRRCRRCWAGCFVQLSDVQRQRVAIARSSALRPEVLVAMKRYRLDALVQEKIFDLLVDM